MASLVESVERDHRHPLTGKVWKPTVGFAVLAHDHDRAKRRSQEEGEGFPNAVYRY